MREFGDGADDALAGELSSLFADDRLAVPTRADAASIIVAGARRRRRRRELGVVGGGAFAVVVLAAGLVFATSQRSDEIPIAGEQRLSTAPAETTAPADTAEPEMSEREAPDPSRDWENEVPPSATVSRDPETPPSPEPEPGEEETDREAPGATVGPDRYGALRLGMSLDDAKETGMLAEPDTTPASGCVAYELAEGTVWVRAVEFYDDVLTLITVADAPTPEGIGVGSSLRELQDTYPGGDGGAGAYLFHTESDSTYYFHLQENSDDIDDSEVVRWRVGERDSNCW